MWNTRNVIEISGTWWLSIITAAIISNLHTETWTLFKSLLRKKTKQNKTLFRANPWFVVTVKFFSSPVALHTSTQTTSVHLIKIHSIWGVMCQRTSDQMWQLVRETLLSSFLSHFLVELTLELQHPLTLITFDRSGMRMSGWKVGKQFKRGGRKGKWVETPGVSEPDVDTGLTRQHETSWLAFWHLDKSTPRED